MTTPNLRDVILTAPADQIDDWAREIARFWPDDPSPLQILELIDKCAYAGAASGFLIKVCQTCYELACANEDTTHEEVVKGAAWRSEV